MCLGGGFPFTVCVVLWSPSVGYLISWDLLYWVMGLCVRLLLGLLTLVESVVISLGVDAIKAGTTLPVCPWFPLLPLPG